MKTFIAAVLAAAVSAQPLFPVGFSDPHDHSAGQIFFAASAAAAAGGPEQLWLAFGATPDVITVSWLTNGTGAQTVVSYGAWGAGAGARARGFFCGVRSTSKCRGARSCGWASFTRIHAPCLPLTRLPVRHRERHAGQDGDGRAGQAVHVRIVHERRHSPGDAQRPGPEDDVLLLGWRGRCGVHRALFCFVARRGRVLPVHLCRHRGPRSDGLLRRHVRARQRELHGQFRLPHRRRVVRGRRPAAGELAASHPHVPRRCRSACLYTRFVRLASLLRSGTPSSAWPTRSPARCRLWLPAATT